MRLHAVEERIENALSRGRLELRRTDALMAEIERVENYLARHRPE